MKIYLFGRPQEKGKEFQQQKWTFLTNELLITVLISILVLLATVLWLLLSPTSLLKINKRAAWHPTFNTYQAVKHAYAETLNVSNCWVCAAIPTAHEGIPLKAIPLSPDETWINLLYQTSNVTTKDKIALQLFGQQKGTLCFQKNGTIKVGLSSCNNTVIYHSCDGPLTISIRRSNKGTVTSYSTSNAWCSANFTVVKELLENTTDFAQETKVVHKKMFQELTNKKDNPEPADMTVTKVKNCYFVCGKNAYKWLPKDWSGSCFLGYLIPAIRHVSALPQGKIRNVREVKKPTNPVGRIDASWIYHHDLAHVGTKGLSHMSLGDDVIAGAGILPAYGAPKAIWELRKLSKLLEVLSNATFSALELVTDELTAMRTVVLQNRMALDFTLAAKGGVCALVKDECCTFIPDSQHEIESHLEVIQQISELTKPGPTPLTDFFQRLFGGWGSFFMNLFIAICVGLIFLLLGCCCIPCMKGLVNNTINTAVNKTLYQQLIINVLEEL